MLLEFILACILIEMTPGPNMLWLALLSASEGRRSGLAATFGIAIGLSCAAVFSAIGLAQVTAVYPQILIILNFLGMIFMFWLAWEALRESYETSLADVALQNKGGGYIVKGIAINLLNAKAFLFFLTVLPGFITAKKSVFTQTMLLSFLYIAIATMVHLGIILAASPLKIWLDTGRHRQSIQRIFAAMLVGIGIWVGSGLV